MSSEIAIKVENLSKCYQIYEQPRDRLKQMLMRGRRQYYREFWAVRDISFEIKKGETVGIVGRNGSGKSTLLQMICGTLNPTGGSIQANGRIAALLELGSGFNPEFTGRENVYLNAAVLGLSKEEIDQRFGDIADFADIGEFIERPVKTYSSGMMVRLAFAVQAMVDPEILIVDEALAVGDEKFQRKCFSRLEELKSRGTSILFVSHSGPQVIELCDRALMIERGSLVMSSSPQDVIRSYQRLIYAPEAEQEQLLCEFRERSSSWGGTIVLAPKAQASFDECVVDLEENIDLFDSGLVPETTTIYPEQGAKIERIEIQDMNGKVVNVLNPKKTYRIVFCGRFHGDFEKIYFGVHIKSISGAVVSGQRYPEEGQYLSIEEAGTFRITYSFDMDLLPGTYFIGGGIWSSLDSVCAHRILDAIMFRVTSNGPQVSFGYCDLASAPAKFELGRL
jgi:lipopolysaccharide transport system ATP-binding protein